MRILVTGRAKGFTGSADCWPFIMDLGNHIVVVDKLAYAGNPAWLNGHCTLPEIRLGAD